jgi:hypothetical protein
VAVDETVEHVVPGYRQPVAGKGRHQVEETIPQDGKTHGPGL